MPRFMMLIKGDQPPGEMPSEEMVAALGEYNEALAAASVLIDLAALHPSVGGADGMTGTSLRGPGRAWPRTGATYRVRP